MLLGVVSVLAVATVVIGLPVWLLFGQRKPAPKARPPSKGALAETGEWVFSNPAETAGGAQTSGHGQAPAASHISSKAAAQAHAKTAAHAQAKSPGEASPTAATVAAAGDAPLHEVEPLTTEQVFAALHQLSLGSSAVGESWPPTHAEVISATADLLQDAATEDRYTPRRPSLLPQLLRAMNDEEVSRRELVTIISRDPSLVGNLLKMANSPFYRVSAQAVESIDRAVVILGNDGIRSLIAAALAQPIFHIRGGDFPKFPEIAWEHTFRTASATVTHTAIVEKSDPFAAQLLGLVAGMAAIVVFRVALDQYDTRPSLKPHAGVIASLLDTQTAGVGKRIAASWGLSDRILAALDDQTTAVAADKHTALGRSLEFGRTASALAVLYVHKALDDVTAQVSLPVANMPAMELQRLWTRLTAEPEAAARKKPRAAAR
ncbi:MAG TPA: HDOD domain-containing protein [Steroidobacteraceae bacterium]|nr:HDOD domain-containing protein [Steroidobacteraceae bacterium]